MRKLVFLLLIVVPAILKAQVLLTGTDGVVLAGPDGKMLTTSCGSFTVSDVDGNNYSTVRIGDQCWLGKNLATTRYNDGTLIGTTTPVSLDISGATTPKYQWSYDGNEGNVSVYGRLYTWHAVTDSRNVCPAGWHVPTEAEWTILATFLGGASIAGGKLKETGTVHWSAPNTDASNSSGFTAIPGGFRYSWGVFRDMGPIGTWWSSTSASSAEARYLELQYNNSQLYSGSSYKENGFSVRCIRD